MTTIPVRDAADRFARIPVPDGYDDVALVHWPDGEDELAERRAAGHATLLVVAAGHRPPEAWGPLEDWLRQPFDSVDLYARRERLRRRLDACAPARFDDDGLLQRGRRWVALAPREDRLVRALLPHQGRPVPRAALVEALYPETREDPHRALDTFVRRARTHIAPLGLAIHTVRGIGYMLESRDLPSP